MHVHMYDLVELAPSVSIAANYYLWIVEKGACCLFPHNVTSAGNCKLRWCGRARNGGVLP